MLMQPVPAAQGISRPFVVGLVMLLLFLSMQADWGSVKQTQGGRRGESLRRLGFAASPEAGELPTAHDKVIYELSVTLEQLERQNWQMKQHILDMRRGMRKDGCDGNGTLFTFPDLEEWLRTTNDPRLPQNATRASSLAQPRAQPQELASHSTAHQRHKASGAHSGSHRLRAGHLIERTQEQAPKR